MTIQSLYIKSFGKINNKKIDFSEGYNLSVHENGFGKTTVALFIRAMLYGVEYNKKRRGDESVSEASALKPWDGEGVFGGEMTFSHNGATYSVERYFGLTAKAEKLTVTDCATGKLLDVENVGETFLGLNKESFDRSAYLPQEFVEMKSTDNFDRILAGLVENGAEDYAKVQSKLRDYRKKFRYERGNGGELYRLETKKYELERKLQQAFAAEKAAENARAELKRNKAQLAETEKQIDNFRHIVGNLQQRIAQIQPTAEQTENRRRLWEINQRLEKYPDVEKDGAEAEALLERYRAQSSAVQPQKSKGGAVVVAAVVAALLVICGVALAFAVNVVLGIALAACGAVSAAVAALLFKKQKRAKAEQDALAAQLRATENNLVALLGKYVDCRSGEDIFAAYGLFRRLCNDVAADRRASELLKNSVTVSENAATEQQLRRQLDNAERNLGVLTEKQSALAREQGRLEAEQKAFADVSPASIEEQIENISAQWEKANYNYVVATRVAELLEQAKENLSVSYLPKLYRRCAELLSYVTGESYEVFADRDFAIKLRKDGQTHSVESFSRGIREIALLCFRIALSELLFDGNIPFLIIDDAFVNFDEENFARAIKLLRTISQTTQVIYFTCHRRALKQ